jgi:hypothetical protein
MATGKGSATHCGNDGCGKESSTKHVVSPNYASMPFFSIAVFTPWDVTGSAGFFADPA